MKLLILCPGRIPESVNDIRCFTDVLNYYLPTELNKIADATIAVIPSEDGEILKKSFATLDFSEYDAILTLTLRFYSKISRETTQILRNRFKGILCQVHDGTRLDNDPVDVTFTFKDDSHWVELTNNRLARHFKYNHYMGWAADSDLNRSEQSSTDLRILIDHTNYGNNPIDRTSEVIFQVKRLIDSNIWKDRFETISVRRFDSGRVIDVDFTNTNIITYDRSAIPFTEVCQEHSRSHIFMVTHPESVGLVVLETSVAGALTVSPVGFIPRDRLDTVRHIEWSGSVDWKNVINNINPSESRKVATMNTWGKVAQNILEELELRIKGNFDTHLQHRIQLATRQRYANH